MGGKPSPSSHFIAHYPFYHAEPKIFLWAYEPDKSSLEEELTPPSKL